MRINARNFTPLIRRSGVHTLELHLDGVRYRLTDTEARTLATDLFKLVDPQKD